MPEPRLRFLRWWQTRRSRILRMPSMSIGEKSVIRASTFCAADWKYFLLRCITARSSTIRLWESARPSGRSSGLQRRRTQSRLRDYSWLTLVLFRTRRRDECLKPKEGVGRRVRKSRQKEAAGRRTRALCKLNGAREGCRSAEEGERRRVRRRVAVRCDPVRRSEEGIGR
jgi:hypothetical protein